MAKRLWELFYTFAKVGVMTFGGGYAMLPILQREVVENKGWATEEELAERDILRREYIDAIKSTLCGHLDNTYIVDMAGHKHPLKKKTEAKPENVIPFPKKP